MDIILSALSPLLLLLVFHISVSKGKGVDLKEQRIQVESLTRDYRSGPVDGVYMLSTYEVLLLTVEDMGKTDDQHIWQWTMMTDEESGAVLCDISKAYKRGESAAFICKRREGEYYAFAKLVATSTLDEYTTAGLQEYLESKKAFCGPEMIGIEAFMLNPDAEDQEPSQRYSTAKDGSVVSDPIKIVESQYCFVWAYRIDEMDRVGYVSTQAEPMDPSEGSYVKYRLRMWITEPNAMTENEVDHSFPQSEYATVLTRRLKTKGLEPCIRYAHQAIELEDAVPTYVLDPSGDGVFWTINLKAHTNSIISSLSDLSFTIASRQHIALYGCFIAETRVLLDTRQFSFLKAQRNEMSKINLANSHIPPVLRQLMTTKLKHLQGNYVRYIGRPWDYEDTAHRRDVQLFQNPCMTLEFVFAARGVAYMTQNWLQPGSEDISQIALPSLTADILSEMGAREKAAAMTNQTQTKNPTSKYVPVYDFALTSMHLVLLTANSHIFLHPTSIIYEGFGLIRETQSYRPGALVGRRWCATTGTPKEHNMIVPAFSMNGNLIVVQIVPGEETKTMWVEEPAHSCQQPRRQLDKKKKKGKKSDGEKDKKFDLLDEIEYCIHHKEVPKIRSTTDEENVEEEEERKEKCKRLVKTSDKESGNSSEQLDKVKDNLLAFWISGQTLLDAKDPHFIAEDEEESSGADTKEASTNFNSHILYEADRKGRKLAQIFSDNGLELVSIKMTMGKKPLLWLHDVQFTAIERQFMLAIEIKSKEIKNADFAMAMMSLTVRGQPVRVTYKNETQILDTDILFPGVLIVRPADKSGKNDSRLEGSVRTFTMNTALNNLVIHVDHTSGGKSEDILIYASFDGSQARPLGFLPSPTSKPKDTKIRFTEKHPTVGGSEGILKPDVVVSAHGLISVLFRKANQTDTSKTSEEEDDYPQAVIIGSTAINEPLRKVKPFKGSSYIFQRLTTDGEIIFADYRLEMWKNGQQSNNGSASSEDFYPKLTDIQGTRFLATPFESVLRGSVDTGDEKLDEEDGEMSLTTICPFSHFQIHFHRFDFAEVEYQTRITAELMYHGSAIPLEADILVEFDDQHGISVHIQSAIEENRDQTLVRKTIDIHTFLTPAGLDNMYKYHETHDDGSEIKEEITIFGLTIRPSIVNSHCRSVDLFKTISVNVGCNPFTSMRFIPEAVGLKKVPFLRSKDYTDRENQWTVTREGDNYEVTIPRRKINFAQRKLFKCQSETSDKRGYCTIPRHFTKLFKENIYSIHFTKSIVPKFEQRLTRHMRRVTGNIFLYNLLGGEIKTNTSLLDSKCHNMAPACAPADNACSAGKNDSALAKLQDQPWTTNFFETVNQLNHHTDIYRHYRDCFSKERITADKEVVKVPRGLPLTMSTESYWIFNSTNFNAFSFKKHRNIIFLLRAVVLNTPDNGFTYCQQLETFFLLQMSGVAPSRQPLPWHFYLGLITFVLFIFVLVYFYFARSSRWQSEVSSRRIREEEEKEQREADAKHLEQNDPNSDAFAKWATNLRTLAMEKEKQRPVDSNKLFSAQQDISRTGNVDHSGDQFREAKPLK